MTERFELIEDAQRRLILRRPGQEDAQDVRVRRSFPWSSPRRFISIRDREAQELLLINDMEQLDPENRRAIESRLAEYSLIPKIVRIDHVDVHFGYQQWRVDTDRGPAEFRVQEREDIRFMPDGRFSVRDADGMVYELPGLDRLDDHSRRALEALL